jgi:tRNA A37 methylthiotransferase MiaB
LSGKIAEGRSFYLAVRKGCPRRCVDAARIFEYFRRNDWTAVEKMRAANLIVVYTCGGFDHTEKRTLRTLEQALASARRGTTVVATGCLNQINPESLERLNVLKIPASDLGRLDAMIGATMPFDSTPFVGVLPPLVHDLHVDSFCRKLVKEMSPASMTECPKHLARWLKAAIVGPATEPVIPRQAYSLLVSKGCASTCSYCAIRLSMGRVRSRPIPEIMSEFRRALLRGHECFVLIGEDVGAYGIDCGQNFCDLLAALFSVPGDFKVILNDVNPRWLPKYETALLRLLSENRQRVHSLVLPIQSGSDRILGLMRRGYRVADIEQVLLHLRQRVPDLNIVTHMIVGFPSETEEDFRASLRLIESNHFSAVDIYRYSERKMTSAAAFLPKVQEETIRAREAVLRRTLERFADSEPRHESVALSCRDKPSASRG